MNKFKSKAINGRSHGRVKPHLPIEANNGADFDAFVDTAVAQVEHLSVFEFIRLIPHDWKAPDIERLADKARRMAEALDLPYVRPPHTRLAGLRLYPKPLWEWIYKEYRIQYAWPAVTAPALDDGKKKRASALRQLDEAVADAPENIRQSLQAVINYLECVTGEKSTPESATTSAPTVLRPV